MKLIAKLLLKWNGNGTTQPELFQISFIYIALIKVFVKLLQTLEIHFFTKNSIFYKKFDFFFEFWAKLSKGVKTFFNILPQNYFGNEIQSTWIEFSIRYAIWDCNTLPINNELTERISNTKRGIQAGYLYIEKRAI